MTDIYNKNHLTLTWATLHNHFYTSLLPVLHIQSKTATVDGFILQVQPGHKQLNKQTWVSEGAEKQTSKQGIKHKRNKKVSEWMNKPLYQISKQITK